MTSRKGKPKAFNDPIHGLIQLDWVYVRIIDTVEFQRLRNIKQLGTAHLVYPSAVHTRFEHSIGTCYLALKLVQNLRKDENLGITDKEQLCVGLAALLHDIGHGPFSHLFEKIIKDGICGEKHSKTWKHELASCKIFDMMVEKYELLEHFRKCQITDMTIGDIHLVKEMICGPLEKNSTLNGNYKKIEEYQSHLPPSKYFLYEIVSNKTSGMDVDKWEYFARDCHHLGIANNFDHNRFIEFSNAVITDERTGKRQLCLRDKEAHNAYEMFHTRYRLYRQAYYHTVTLATEVMIKDIIREAVDHFEIRVSKKPESDPEIFTIKSALDDMEAYLQLDDTVLTLIFHSAQGTRNPNLQRALRLYKRLQERKIYKLVKKISLPKYVRDPVKAKPNLDDIIKAGGSEVGSLTSDDLYIQPVKYNYGKRGENPVNYIHFYSKEDEGKAFIIPKDQVSQLLPDKFEELQLLFYVKETDKFEEAKLCVNTWHETVYTDWLKPFHPETFRVDVAVQTTET